MAAKVETEPAGGTEGKNWKCAEQPSRRYGDGRWIKSTRSDRKDHSGRGKVNLYSAVREAFRLNGLLPTDAKHVQDIAGGGQKVESR
jgi:hypothetical protein